jgi:hypothetical protein
VRRFGAEGALPIRRFCTLLVGAFDCRDLVGACELRVDVVRPRVLACGATCFGAFAFAFADRAADSSRAGPPRVVRSGGRLEREDEAVAAVGFALPDFVDAEGRRLWRGVVGVAGFFRFAFFAVAAGVVEVRREERVREVMLGRQHAADRGSSEQLRRFPQVPVFSGYH